MQIDDGPTECTAPQEISAHDESDISGAESSIDKSMCGFNSDDDQGDDVDISFVSTCEPGSPQFSHGGMYQYSYYSNIRFIIRLVFLFIFPRWCNPDLPFRYCRQ